VSGARGGFENPVTTNDGKTYKADLHCGQRQNGLGVHQDRRQGRVSIYSTSDNISPNLLGETVIVVGNLSVTAARSAAACQRGKRDITIDNFEYKNLVQTDARIIRATAAAR